MKVEIYTVTKVEPKCAICSRNYLILHGLILKVYTVNWPRNHFTEDSK